MEKLKHESRVENFYKGKSIFITGATGFLGKVLVEKVLRSCPEVKSVYCLMRPKRNQEPAARFEKFLNDQVFGRLREENPENLKKIHLISGDVLENELGISPQDRALLIREVNVVFHSAASIKFTEPIKFALQMNTFGTRKVIQLCRDLQNLEAFIHVSTCYSNAIRKNITEEVFTPPMDPDELDQFLSKVPDDISFDEKCLIGDHPNTYTFTKAMAEYITATECGNIPTAIVRPSVIAGSLNEPYPGWIDNFAGITGVTIGISSGTFRTCICDTSCNFDLIPADLVANTIIVTAANLHYNKPTDGCVVYNCSSGSQNPLTYGTMLDFVIKSAVKYPSKYVMFYPSCTFRLNKAVHLFISFFLHFLPAFLLDSFFKLRGAKTTHALMRFYQSCRSAEKTGRYFAIRDWNFDTKNLIELAKAQNDVDKQRFNILSHHIQWNSYFDNYVKGINLYLLKDNLNSLPRAKKNLQRLFWVQMICRGVVLISILYLISHIINLF